MASAYKNPYQQYKNPYNNQTTNTGYVGYSSYTRISYDDIEDNPTPVEKSDKVIYVYYTHGGKHTTESGKVAMRDYGALWGQDRGRSGDSYALDVDSLDMLDQMGKLFEYAKTYRFTYLIAADTDLKIMEAVSYAYLEMARVHTEPDNFDMSEMNQWVEKQKHAYTLNLPEEYNTILPPGWSVETHYHSSMYVVRDDTGVIYMSYDGMRYKGEDIVRLIWEEYMRRMSTYPTYPKYQASNTTGSTGGHVVITTGTDNTALQLAYSNKITGKIKF